MSFSLIGGENTRSGSISMEQKRPRDASRTWVVFIACKRSLLAKKPINTRHIHAEVPANHCIQFATPISHLNVLLMDLPPMQPKNLAAYTRIVIMIFTAALTTTRVLLHILSFYISHEITLLSSHVMMFS